MSNYAAILDAFGFTEFSSTLSDCALGFSYDLDWCLLDKDSPFNAERSTIITLPNHKLDSLVVCTLYYDLKHSLPHAVAHLLSTWYDRLRYTRASFEHLEIKQFHKSATITALTIAHPCACTIKFKIKPNKYL